MTNTMKITTKSGTEISLEADYGTITARVMIKGEQHCYRCVKVKHDAKLGDYLRMGPLKALVTADVAADVKAMAAAAEAASAAEFAIRAIEENWAEENAIEAHQKRMHDRMYGRGADRH